LDNDARPDWPEPPVPVQRVVKALEIFQEESGHAAVNISTFLHFVVVATRPGILSSEVADYTGRQKATISRTIGLLSQERRGHEPGLDLVRQERDPSDARRRNLFLTPKGQRIWKKILRILED
jgi:DNA-binding MarR family transcriptional regulator